MRLRKFSMVLPNTELLMDLKKSFCRDLGAEVSVQRDVWDFLYQNSYAIYYSLGVIYWSPACTAHGIALS